MFNTKSHWSGSKPLLSPTLLVLGPYCGSSWISYCCPVSWISCSFESTGSVSSSSHADHRWAYSVQPYPLRLWGYQESWTSAETTVASETQTQTSEQTTVQAQTLPTSCVAIKSHPQSTPHLLPLQISSCLQNTNHSVSRCLPYHLIHVLTIIVPICRVLQGAWWTHVFSLKPRAHVPRSECRSPCPAQFIMALGRAVLLYHWPNSPVPLVLGELLVGAEVVLEFSCRSWLETLGCVWMLPHPPQLNGIRQRCCWSPVLGLCFILIMPFSYTLPRFWDYAVLIFKSCSLKRGNAKKPYLSLNFQSPQPECMKQIFKGCIHVVSSPSPWEKK